MKRKKTMKPLIAFTAAIMTFSARAQAHEEIQDQSGLVWKNPDLKDRKVAKIRLSNGLEAFLISDPKADQSSAAVAVEVGSWSDPENSPGMAHLCEHLLFLGSQKYPDPQEFARYIEDHNGKRNAFTGADRTVYTFSCQTDVFLDALERFSRFYIDPLFYEPAISRELHAVDQEFAKSLESDAWRSYMVAKELVDPEHPHSQFSVGNSETLSKIPQTVFRAWHQEHYTAGRIKLFAYSSLPLDHMKEAAAYLFSEVRPGRSKRANLPLRLMRKETEGNLIYVEPIQEISTLSLSWELPNIFLQDETESARLIAYALKRGQDKGLYELLQNEKLIDSMNVSVEEMGNKHVFFEIDLQLTPLGLQNKEEVITHCFEAIEGLKRVQFPSYLFEERNAIAKLKYEYQPRIDAYLLADTIGRSLLDEPLETFPKKTILSSQFDPNKIAHVLASLIPEKCFYTLSAPSHLCGIEPDKKEKWFGANYAVKTISERQLSAWKLVEPNPEIAIAGPNPFLPTKLDLANIADHSEFPIALSENSQGIAYFYRGAEFSAPSAAIHLHICSPLLQPNAKSSVLTSLYLDHITDKLRPVLAAARSAGLSANFKLARLKLDIQIDGFNDKAPLLLEEILREMSLNPPTLEEFEIYRVRHEKTYRNSEKALPLSQANQLLSSVLFEGKTTDAEKLKALELITFEDLVNFHENLLKKTYLEAVIAGNFTQNEAKNIWTMIQNRLDSKIFAKDEQLKLHLKYLEDQPQFIRKRSKALGNGITLAIDQGPLTLERKAAAQLLEPVLKEAFFHELRTKQKTGYIVDASALEFENHLFEIFLVQSNSHTPDELLHRFEYFLEEFLETFDEAIPLERFDRLKQTAIESLQSRFRNLSDKSALWNFLAFEKGADFEYVQKRIEALNELSKERLFEIAQEMFSRQNKRRLAVLCSGKIENPFVYVEKNN